MAAFVPQHMSRHLAAALASCSRMAIDILIESGFLTDERGSARWSRIPTAQIEKKLRHGKKVSAADYLKARADLARIRNRQPCRQGSVRHKVEHPDDRRARAF
jgi:hypothetical protein